ncbi:MAG: polysaccharide lyase 6 family protein [Acholeplasmataceae bacterium]
MKKITLLFMSFLLIILAGCGKTHYELNEPTNRTTYEEVKAFADNLVLDINHDEVRNNLYLPKKTENPLMFVTWRSDSPKVINDQGHVTRPNAGEDSKKVTLTATITLGGTLIEKDFLLTVLPLASAAEGTLDEDLNDFVLYPFDTIDTDLIILPRVTNRGTYIEWETSDSSIIDLEGNVYLPKEGEADKEVTLSATFTLGGAMKFKDYTFKVTKEKKASLHINEDDPRILNKVHVDEKIGFLRALLNAKPGDAIIVAPGVYNSVNIEMKNGGTKENPIFIMGSPDGKTFIEGESQININADHVVIANFTFQNGHPSTDRGAVWLEGDHLRMTNIMFYQFEQIGLDYKWVSMTGKFHELDHNTFDGKKTGGALLTVWRDDIDYQFHTIRNNIFKNYEDAGGANGYETIRLGTSTYSQSDGFITVEGNYFENVNGEIEIISVKSGRNIIKNNTFKNSLGHITLRHGKNNLVENNVILGGHIHDTGGVRIYDGGHIVRNNYIEAVTSSSNTRAGIVIHSGVNNAGENTVLNAQWTPYYVYIYNNTIIDSKQSLLFGGKYSRPSKDVTLENNFIIAKDGEFVARYDKLPEDVTFIDNYFYSNKGYSGGGAINPGVLPSGIRFSNDLPTIERVNGLKLHQTYGAQDLQIINEVDVGILWD